MVEREVVICAPLLCPRAGYWTTPVLTTETILGRLSDRILANWTIHRKCCQSVMTFLHIVHVERWRWWVFWLLIVEGTYRLKCQTLSYSQIHVILWNVNNEAIDGDLLVIIMSEKNLWPWDKDPWLRKHIA